jgi:tRNA(Ile)-lysidine synthase
MTAVDEIPWFASASRRKRYLVGVSGGADSVALLLLLVDAKFRNLVICHIDHGLRGRASTADAKFVRSLAEKLGLPLESTRVDVPGRMKSRHESMETAARNARHDFFGECAVKHRCQRVLLAHHADDQAETVLWNLLRGSHGLRGMREIREFTLKSGTKLEIVRPLLGLRRAELIGWLMSRGSRWREDASNAEPVAIRNRLRNEALPLLSMISGRDAVQAIFRATENSHEQAELEAWALTQANVLDPQGRLHVPVLRSLPVALQRAALVAYLNDAGLREMDRVQLDRLVNLLDPTQPGSVNLAQGYRMKRRAGRMFLEWISNERTEIH